jgi:hypothetical protein
MRTIMTACSVLVVAALAVGCAAGPAEEKQNNRGSAATSIKRAGDISVSLTAEPRVQESGKSVSLTLAVRNLSGKERTFDLASSQSYDFMAFDKDGGEVWRWSAGMMFAQVISPVTIAPEGVEVYRTFCPTSGSQPGNYAVQGYFLGLNDTRPIVRVELTAPK